MFKRGSKVDADFGKGHIIAFVASGPHGADEKYEIQDPNGEGTTTMAYREPPFGSAGSGKTFKKL